MNKLFALFTIVLVSMMAGCVTPTPSKPSFPAFVTQPKNMLGFGADTFWLYVDPNALADEMVPNGVNCTHVEIFNCSPSQAQSTSADPSPHGFWTADKFDPTLKPVLDSFLKVMQERKITTVITFFGGHDMSKVNDDIFFKILNFLKSRPQGINGIAINMAAEPGTWTKEPYPGYFNHLTQMLDQNWSGMKVWNYGTRPASAPAGYSIEWHPQVMNDYGPNNPSVIIDPDSAVWFGLNIDGSINSKIDPNKLIPYVKAVRAKGHGFIYYGQRFAGWDIDKAGIKAIGDSAK